MVRLAVVGTGRIASVHFKNILNNPNAQCKYVISNSMDRAQQFIRHNTKFDNDNKPTIKASENLENTIKDNINDIDGVIIASASNEHYDQTKLCLLSNKPVFVEKPISDNLSQIDELYTLAKKQNLPLRVGYQRRFDPNIETIYNDIHINKVLLPQNKVEGLTPILGGMEKIISTSRDPTYPNLNYMNSNMNGFYDSIIHDVDTICFIAKQFPYKLYSAATAFFNPIKKFNDFDRVFITMHFQSGLLGLIDWCRHSGASYDQRLNILGYNGMIEMDNEKENLLVRYDNDGMHTSKSVDYFIERYKTAYKNEMDEFVNVISGAPIKKIGIPTHTDVRNANIIVNHALQSAHSGEPVTIHYDETYQTEEGMML